MHVNQKSSAGHGKLSSFAGTIRTLRRLASPHALDNVIQRWDQPLTPNGNHNNMFNPGGRSLRKNTSQGADVPHDLRGIGCEGAAFVPRRRPAGPPPPPPRFWKAGFWWVANWFSRISLDLSGQ